MGQTVAMALRDAARRLERVSPSARLDAELLMAHAMSISRSSMLLYHANDSPPPSFANLVDQRASGRPLAHITGEQEFYGLSLRVTPDVLVPRSDSETLIEAARHSLRGRPPARILDCGTGSGALLLAALSAWSEARGIGIERSQAALAIAQHNARQTQLADRAEMRGGDWTTPEWAASLGRFDLVLANPPYVEDADPDLAADVRAHEPAGALFAGPDGLDAYRALIPQLPDLLTPQGIALVEIGSRQAASVSAIAAAAKLATHLHHDLCGLPRALELWVTAS